MFYDSGLLNLSFRLYWRFSLDVAACRGVSLSQWHSRMSHICHMQITQWLTHTHINELNTALAFCGKPCWWPQYLTVVQETETETDTPEPTVKWTIGIREFVFWINKQLNVSVPYKSHQQSVRATNSGEMRSIYPASPEATGPAQAYVTYYKCAFPTGGRSMSSFKARCHRRKMAALT